VVSVSKIRNMSGVVFDTKIPNPVSILISC
jgi:hypothetical protein